MEEVSAQSEEEVRAQSEEELSSQSERAQSEGGGEHTVRRRR